MREAEAVREIVKRVLKKKASRREEADYLALWDEVVPREIRRHVAVRVRNEKITALADNPTAGHMLFLRKEQITREFRVNNLPIKELVIRQRGNVKTGGVYVSGFNRGAGHAVPERRG